MARKTTTAKKAASPRSSAVAGTKRVTFTVRAEPGSTVGLSGDFNNWDPEGRPMTDKNGDGMFSTTVALKPGTYEYKFIINGVWCADSSCSEWVQNSLGTLNSVVHV